MTIQVQRGPLFPLLDYTADPALENTQCTITLPDGTSVVLEALTEKDGVKFTKGYNTTTNNAVVSFLQQKGVDIIYDNNDRLIVGRDLEEGGIVDWRQVGVIHKAPHIEPTEQELTPPPLELPSALLDGRKY